MNSDNESADLELLKRYRRVSDAAPSQPKDAVREAILAEGRRAAARNAGLVDHQFDTQAPAANRPRWRYAAIGTACAAVLAGFLVIPQFLTLPRERAVVSAPTPVATVSSSDLAADKTAAAPAPKLEAVQPPERDLENSPALIDIPRERAKLSTPPAVAALQKPPPPIRAAEALSGNSAARARKSAAGADASQQVTRQLSSDLKQVTVAPPGATASAAPALPTPEIPPGATASFVPPPRDDAALARSAGTVPDSGLEEIVTTGMRAARSPPTPLISAINWGRAGKAAALLESGQGSVTETDSKGRTPLHRAVAHKRLDLVQLLLANGADPNAPDADGETPLSIARHKNLADIVAALEAVSKQPP